MALEESCEYIVNTWNDMNRTEEKESRHYKLLQKIKQPSKKLDCFVFVRIGVIETPTHPWQGRILPLNHIRNI